MMDSDIWWHLRGGQWILEHHRVPHLDPFTFGSADKVWIDIHWSYQVVLALTYQAGGMGAVVLLGATLGAVAVMLSLTVRRGNWPMPVVIICWMPALVLLGFRLDPRPEMFSLVYFACFLAVLLQVDERPRLAWLLPPVQVLWVNVQGLFILGPVLIGICITARGAALAMRRLRGESVWDDQEKRWWRHVGGATSMVLAACLMNPYGLEAILFPFELFPKIADPNNLYKQSIDELKSPRDYLTAWYVAAPVARAHWPFAAFHFLLLVLPISFLVPALWRAWRDISLMPQTTLAARPEMRVRAWAAGVVGMVGVTAAYALAPFGSGWSAVIADYIPHVIAVGSVLATLKLPRLFRPVAALLLAGGMAQAMWMIWVRSTLLRGQNGLLAGTDYSGALLLPLILLGLCALAMAVWWNGGLFRMLLTCAFIYLGLQAIQNSSRFAIVAGAILTANFGEWASQLVHTSKPGTSRAAKWIPRALLGLALSLWITALVADGYHACTGEPRHFGFREQPLEFAHEATIFAAQPELPKRALVYDLGQTGVYDFHNAPQRKVFMDGRLEMPDYQTFKTYILIQQQLQQRDVRSEQALTMMGNPLLLMNHRNNFGAEAFLLTLPAWRCIYYDAVAAVFIHRDSGVPEKQFPSVEFSSRHFAHAGGASIPDVPGAAAAEAEALFNLVTTLPKKWDQAWKWRIPALLLALDRSRLALTDNPSRANTWHVLGSSYWYLNPDLSGPWRGPEAEWKPEETIYWAQTTYCLRRALECEPRHRFAWRTLYQSFAARSMVDAQAACGEIWLRFDPHAGATSESEVADVNKAVRAIPAAVAIPGRLPVIIAQLLNDYRPAEAARILDAADREFVSNWTWEYSDLAAGLYMHLGRPADARLLWERARACPSGALRSCRVAATFWAEGELDAASRLFRQAAHADPRLPEAWWGLAMVRAQAGDAGTVREACREALRLPLNERMRNDLESLLKIVNPPVPTS